MTKEGNIVVNGILTSCYADFDHNLGHLTMKPMQWIPMILEWIFGNDMGFPVYVSTARQLGILMLPDGYFVGHKSIEYY